MNYLSYDMFVWFRRTTMQIVYSTSLAISDKSEALYELENIKSILHKA